MVSNASTLAPSSADSGTSAAPRIPAIDVARGVAIVAMVIYHFTWDLGHFNFIELQAGIDPAWRMFARLIAGSFLLLVGIGLVLADRGGLRRGPYARRLMFVTGGALLITIGTYVATPDSFVFFGILHCIALSSVLAVPFLRAPLWVTALIAMFVLTGPLYLAGPEFNGPAWWWLGLSSVLPMTNDYEPVFPWFGVVLSGVVLARLALMAGVDRTLALWKAADPVSRLLRFGGRHSLVIYLVHQPVLFGLLSLAVALGAPTLDRRPDAAEAAFVRSCTRNCQATGAEAGYCTATCACVADELQGSAVLGRSLAGPLTAADQKSIRDAALLCRGQPPDSSPPPGPSPGQTPPKP